MGVRWDIFCRVIDNFGDVGVTWRLARQLAAEHDVDVRLWIDDLPSFVRLCPLADANTYQQLQQGVEIWPNPISFAERIVDQGHLILHFVCSINNQCGIRATQSVWHSSLNAA